MDSTGRPATEEAWQPHESEALAAIAAASGASELEEARVRYLGRKSEVAQALRGVRDRDAGMLLNGIRG
ncbi:MAG: phenylalanine--tRNA ligase subunit alpha, partial [Gaiellaceae bacterium]